MDAPYAGFNFPDDVWAQVVCFLAGEALIRLKMIGSKHLWDQLRHPNIVKSLILERNFFKSKTWPAFLNEFPSLDDLSIDIHSEAAWPKASLKLSSIPPRVRQLHFTVFFPSTFFEDENGRTLKLDECLPDLEVLDLRWASIEEHLWMAHCPPTLTKLRIRDWAGQVELPPSLIHFEALNVNLEPNCDIKLPPNLETFLVSTVDGLDVLVPLLPPSLISFKGYSNQSFPNILAQLPKFLTSLHLSANTLTLGSTTVALLPYTLTKLNAGVNSSSWSFLPSSIKHLSCRVSSACRVASNPILDPKNTSPASTLYTYPLETLPRSITHLEISSEQCYWGPPSAASLAAPSYFPPKLEYLRISHIHLSPEAAKLLPSTLTYLSVENICEQICQHLPKGLTQLFGRHAWMSPNFSKFLPKSLTSLDLECAETNIPWYDYRTGARQNSVSNLPGFSVHEKEVASVDWKGEYAFPPNLTYLQISSFYVLGDSFVLNHQLPYLATLHLESSRHFSDLSIPLLSRHLTRLNLSASDKISGKCFPQLPRGLTYLNLRSSPSIFDSDIKHLPRTLKVAHLDYSIHLTNLCISDLPRSLERVSLMGNEKITPTCFAMLPPLIRSKECKWRSYMGKWIVDGGEIKNS